jgi:electron transport complex protein RnfC
MNTVKLPHHAASQDKRTRVLPLPDTLIVPMAQSVGSPCEPLVKVGEDVAFGQKIGESTALISAPIHAGVCGKVSAITERTFGARPCKCIVIDVDKNQETGFAHSNITPPVVTDRDSFIEAVRASGLVGQGGAGFPTHVKLGYDTNKYQPDLLVINAAECEPYITSDYRGILEHADDLIAGIELCRKFLGLQTAYIGIEKDKPEAITILKEKISGNEHIRLKVLPTRYPQGAEKILVRNVTGRIIPEGELPLSAGCVVMNSTTAAFIARYIIDGVPLIRKRVTIDGDIVNKPQNVFVPVGTPLSFLIKQADLRIQPRQILFGGLMMGQSVFDPDTPITKTTNAVLFFGDKKSEKQEKSREARFNHPTACIRCGKCLSVCPMNLRPTDIEHAFDRKNGDALRKLHVNLCMNCGSCTFICPARRNLAEKNQVAAALLRTHGL